MPLLTENLGMAQNLTILSSESGVGSKGHGSGFGQNTVLRV